jgi:hypothetical protein
MIGGTGGIGGTREFVKREAIRDGGSAMMAMGPGYAMPRGLIA